MNIAHVIDEIEKVDGELYERISPRRKAMKDFFRLGSKVAVAAAPMLVASIFKKAYGQTVPEEVVRVLQFALKLEHLEYNFYKQGLTSAPIPAGAERLALETIRDSEKKHVDFLIKLITDIKKVPEAELTTYDFTAGAVFSNVFSDYATFLTVAQVLEDTGVRAYKGRVPELRGQKVYLTTLLGMHATEARHAAKVRYMRRKSGQLASLKPYITGGTDTDARIPPGHYGGLTPESNVKQAEIIITNINGLAISTDAATEAFDEPLTVEEVAVLVKPFGIV